MCSLMQCIDAITDGKNYRLLGGMSNNVVTFENDDVFLTGSDYYPGFCIKIQSKRKIVGYGVDSVVITKNVLKDLEGRIIDSSLIFTFYRVDGSPYATVHPGKDTISVKSDIVDDKSFKWSIDDGALRLKYRDGGNKGNDTVNISDWPIDKIIEKIYFVLVEYIGSLNLMEEFHKLFDVIRSLLISNVVAVAESWKENINTNIGIERRYNNDTTSLERDLEIITSDISGHTNRV